MSVGNQSYFRTYLQSKNLSEYHPFRRKFNYLTDRKLNLKLEIIINSTFDRYLPCLRIQKLYLCQHKMITKKT